MFVVVNVGTERAYSKKHCSASVYQLERTARAQCTRLNREYTGCSLQIDANGQDVVQWKVMSVEAYNARPVKMVERINLMSGLPYMEAEDTPYFCSPSSETYWSR
jgi:hypothetical protein